MRIRTAAVGLATAAMLLSACSDNNVQDYRDTHTSRAPATEGPTSDEPTEEPTSEEPTDDADEGHSDGQTAQPEELKADVELSMSSAPAIVTWETPGETFHVYTQGSSTEGCYPVPTEAWTDGERIEIDFDPAEPGRACTMDIVPHGWSFTWEEPIEVTGEMMVEMRGLNLTGRIEIPLPPEPTEPIA